MENADYWPIACKYAIWNGAISSLHFWAEDLDPITLGIISECICITFFWMPTSHTLCQLPEDVLFGCFVIALNAAFTQHLSFSRRKLWTWFWHQWFTNAVAENSSHTPHIQHGPCLLKPCEHYTSQCSHHYTSQYSHHYTLEFATNYWQTSVLMPILQLQYRPYPRQHSRMFQQLRCGRFPNSTIRGWTLDIRDSAWKNFLHTWKWTTK